MPSGLSYCIRDFATAEVMECPAFSHCTLILFCIKSIASKGRAEGFQRAIGKPFGRARRREISVLGKVIVLSENNINHILICGKR